MFKTEPSCPDLIRKTPPRQSICDLNDKPCILDEGYAECSIYDEWLEEQREV